MITSDRQLKVTKERIEMLKTSLGKNPNKDINPILHKSARLQTDALIHELQIQVDDYQRLQSKGNGI